MFFNYRDASLSVLKNHILRFYPLDGPFEPNMKLILIVLMITVCLVPLWIRLYRTPANLRTFNPDGSEERYWRGFKGWFLLFTLVILVEPIRGIIGLHESWFLLSKQTYSILTSPDYKLFSKWYTVSIYSNFLFYSIRFSFACLLIACLGGRKRIFRVLTTSYLILDCLMFALTHFFYSQIFDLHHEIIFTSFINLSQSVQILPIIIPFLFVSRRVHGTLIR